jgi:LPS O-antigen subunit length determinant protein (WzzB/FepE family)
MLDSQKQMAMKLSVDSIEYQNLRSEVVKKRETLGELLKRESEITLSSHMRDNRQSNTRIIDAATTPREPYRPNKKINLTLGLLTGLALGPGLRSRSSTSTTPSSPPRRSAATRATPPSASSPSTAPQDPGRSARARLCRRPTPTS